MQDEQAKRETAIHLLRAGQSVDEVGQAVGRSVQWVRKWRRRYESEGWRGLVSRSHAPKQPGNQLSTAIKQAIITARSELDAEAARRERVVYVGARAVRTRLKAQGVSPLPSRASIERVLHHHGLTRQPSQPRQPTIHYPHMRPNQPHQLCQVDIVPHFLTGGARVACFNAVDVVSRAATGQAYAGRRALDATEFLRHLWQTLGVARYTQVDNEGCFSGGATHPYVLGQVVRLALWVGTELVFSPPGHPQSNAFVERFHQEYDRFVWDQTYLADLAAVQGRGIRFFADYGQSEHHVALAGQAPTQVHQDPPPRLLTSADLPPTQRLPLRVGRVHFMRRPGSDQTVSVLNVPWALDDLPPANSGVWVTLELTTTSATLAIFDAPPDQPTRRCLATHPFLLSEPVHPGPASSVALSTIASQDDTPPWSSLVSRLADATVDALFHLPARLWATCCETIF